MRRTALALMPLARAIRSAVQWVVSTGGSASVSATTRAATSGPSGGMREGRVLSCRRPSMPSFMNRSCQRQTQVFDLPVRRMISLVPTPSALERMIAARQACFCEALRSLVIASSRPRTDRVIVMEIPVRMRQTRTATETEESQSGLFCQAKTTSFRPSLVMVRNPAAGQEYLFAVLGLDCTGRRGDRGSCRLRIASDRHEVRPRYGAVRPGGHGGPAVRLELVHVLHMRADITS